MNSREASVQQQIIVSGIGGQGVLFITRILAEAALRMNLSVLVSETHGMAQRGGNVISHLKVGDLTSAGPLIRPGRADIFLGLHPDSFTVHGHFLKPDGLAFLNGPSSEKTRSIDAADIARELGSPVSANLVLLGFALASGALFCSPDTIRESTERLAGNRREIALKALEAGLANASPIR